MQRLFTQAAITISLAAFTAAPAGASPLSLQTQSGASSPAQAQGATPTQPQHKKPQTYIPGEAAPPAPAAKQPQSTMTAPEFDHVALEVRDIAKSADFYQRVIGLTAIADPFNDTQHVFLRLGAHSQLHLVAAAADTAKDPLPQRPMHVHFALRVASVPEFAARLDRMKVAYRGLHNEPQKMTKRPDGVMQMYFQDPDGYWVEVNDNKNQ
jgi:lactoylglutathione lyase